MRITLAVPKLDGYSGGLRVVAQYARHLRDSGHEVTLLVRNTKPHLGRRQRLLRRLGLGRRPDDRVAAGFFTGLHIPVLYLAATRPVDSAAIPDADAIVSTWWTTAEWADRLPASKGRHIHFIQGYEDFRPELSGRVQAVYHQQNAKIVISRWLQDMLAARNGCDSLIVLNGIDTGIFSGPPRHPNAVPQLGFLYSPNPVKNCALAIAALDSLRRVRPDLAGICFGRDERPAELPDWVDYERRPAQQRIAQIYASCDAWLFTSASEGFGLPLLEAMACRTPVIATAAGAAPDLVEDGRNGRLLPVDVTPEAMAAVVDGFLAQDAAAWRAASEAAWQTAQRHDLAHAALDFERAIARILHG